MALHGGEPTDRLTMVSDRASKIGRDVFVYFDNDSKVRAPVDAKTLLKKLGVAAYLQQVS